MSRNRIPDTTWVDVLTDLPFAPASARRHARPGISEASLFLKLRQSDERPEDHQIEWLGRVDSFEPRPRRQEIFLLDLDRSALELAMFGHRTPKYFQGAPVWVVDEQAAADAKTMEDWVWEVTYPGRSRADVYARTPDGKLIQAMDASPPNPMLLNKVFGLLPARHRRRAS